MTWLVCVIYGTNEKVPACTDAEYTPQSQGRPESKRGPFETVENIDTDKNEPVIASDKKLLAWRK